MPWRSWTHTDPDDTSPYKHFSGVGIAFKLLMALEDGAGDVEDLLEAYSDLAAIGTTAILCR